MFFKKDRKLQIPDLDKCEMLILFLPLCLFIKELKNFK